MFKKGDDVVTVPGLWHEGINIGERLATVLNTKGHILIAVHQYSNNPVKVFRWEIEKLQKGEHLRLFSDRDIEEMLDEFFPTRHIP